MKNVFDWNLETGISDGDAFVTGRVSPETAEKSDAMAQDVHAFEKKSSLPAALQVVEWISLLAAVILVRGLTKGMSKNDISFAEGFHNAPILYILAVAFVLLFLILLIAGRCRSRQAVKTTDMDAMNANALAVIMQIRQELQIPANAPDVDVLCSKYTMKEEKKHVVGKGWYKFDNVELTVYRKADKLCFTNYRQEWSIPLAEIQGVTQVQKKVQVSQWNKSEPVTDKKFKPYKPVNNNGSVYVKAYSAMQIQSIWGEFEILVPNYDADTVLQLAGLTAAAQ